MWGNIATEATFQTNFNVGFSNTKSDILIHLSQWQYWWWFWFVFLWSLYFMLIIRVVRFRTLKFQPRIVTSFRPHGKWGDLLVCLIPTMWCINILINSTFLLKLIEWQNETSLFTIRIRGKQWYWIYKFDVKDIADILSIGKNVGHDKFFFPTPNSLDNLDDYLRLIQLRASNAWLKKYWDVSLKLQAKENYDHLVSSSDQIPTIPTYKVEQIPTIPIYRKKVSLLNSSTVSSVERLLELRKSKSKISYIDNHVNLSGRTGFYAYLYHVFNEHRSQTLFFEEQARERYYLTYTFYAEKSVYDYFYIYRNKLTSHFFPNKYRKQFEYDNRLRLMTISDTLQSFARSGYVKTKMGYTGLLNSYWRFRESVPFYDFRGFFDNYWERPIMWNYEYSLLDVPGDLVLRKKSYSRIPMSERCSPGRFKKLQENLGHIKKYNSNLLFNDFIPTNRRSLVTPNNFYVPLKKNINFDEGLRWIKRGFGTNEPLKLIKVSYDKGEGFLFKTRYTLNDTAMHKNVTYNPYLVIKQKRYTLKKKILEKNFKTHNKNFIPNKDRIVVSKSNFFLKNNVTAETYDNLTKLYKFFKKNKKRDEMFSVVTARRLLRTKRTLVLPAHVNITAITNSYDVVHSWFIPGLGLKLDCIPGRATHHTFYADNVGFYYGQCAEICGRYHHHMPIRLCILPYDQFLVWWHHFGLPKLMYSGKNRVHTNNFYFRKYVW